DQGAILVELLWLVLLHRELQTHVPIFGPSHARFPGNSLVASCPQLAPTTPILAATHGAALLLSFYGLRGRHPPQPAGTDLDQLQLQDILLLWRRQGHGGFLDDRFCTGLILGHSDAGN